jgi:hypothetical protein
VPCCDSCATGYGHCDGGGCQLPPRYPGAAAAYAPVDVIVADAPAWNMWRDWAQRRELVTAPAGALPGGLTQTQWEALTPAEQTTLVQQQMTNSAATTQLIADAIKSGATGILQIIQTAQQQSIAGAQTDAARAAAQERARLELETAQLQAAQTAKSTGTTMGQEQKPAGATSSTTTPDAPTGLSTGAKVAIVGGVIALGGLAWYLLRARANPTPAAEYEPPPRYIEAEAVEVIEAEAVEVIEAAPRRRTTPARGRNGRFLRAGGR